MSPKWLGSLVRARHLQQHQQLPQPRGAALIPARHAVLDDHVHCMRTGQQIAREQRGRTDPNCIAAADIHA